MKPNASPHRGWHTRGYLPHCDFPGLLQSVSIRLFDSVPTEVIERWVRELDTASDKKL
jgi:putative transposase